MKSVISSVMLIFGIFILIAGVAAPATTQQTSTTCYNSPFGYGQECVQTTYDSPSGKIGLIVFGFLITIAGGTLMFFNLISDLLIYSSPVENEGISLAEQIEQNQRNEEEDEDKPDYLKIGK